MSTLLSRRRRSGGQRKETLPPPARTSDPVLQDIRLAVVLNGGVSLAIWISGVTHELNGLVQASRRRGTTKSTNDAYADLLGVLKANARIDVIAGTSAGGINGGFLSLGLVRGCDLSGLRTLWQEQGDLGTLLRSPREENPPSLLRGEYFHDQLAKAYRTVWRDNTGSPGAKDEDVDLFLTGTLWDGRRSFFADDMGRRITETDHDATFHFTSDPETLAAATADSSSGDLTDEDVTAQLAVASRCTASFPAAFEPFPVHISKEAVQEPDGRWPSDAGRANFQRSQFLIDGGILRNKPVRPAIDAVYRQPADQQVRRILAYVVPDPGEAATGPGTSQLDGSPPGAADVMLAVMTRLRSTDSVADELAEIEQRNHQTVRRRRARDRLAQTLVDAARPGGVDLVASAYPGYLEVRQDDTAESVARLLLSKPGKPRWSQHEVATELRVVASDPRVTFPFLPPDDLGKALAAARTAWPWGQATVRRLGDLVLDVLKRAVWLAPLTGTDRTTIVAQRKATHATLRKVRAERLVLDEYWRNAELPGRRDELTASPKELGDLRDTLKTLAEEWGKPVPGTPSPRAGMAGRLRDLALELAGHLLAAKGALDHIADLAVPAAVDDQSGTEQERLRSLVRLLVPDEATVADVLRNMLRLEVVHVAFTGVSDEPEQAVELVQISSLEKELVTGIQLHHFGAFYRQSWRANDWLRGRVDGSTQLIQMLLAPERLRQIYDKDWRSALAALRTAAVGRDDGEHYTELCERWDAEEGRLSAELQVLAKDDPLPRTFPLVAERISCRIRTEFLMQELDSLADAAVNEPDAVEAGEKWGKEVRTTLRRPGKNRTEPSAFALEKLLKDSATAVGKQTIAQEAARGSDTFARTASHATATLTATAASVKKPRAAVTLLKALRGYALLLWTLVDFLAGRSHVGRALAGMAVGVGGALIAVSLVVPGVPPAVPLTGVVLILATASAIALTRARLGFVRFGLRLVLLLAVALAALAWVVWEASDRDLDKLRDMATDVGLRVLPVVAVLLAGWFLARPTGQWKRRWKALRTTSRED